MLKIHRTQVLLFIGLTLSSSMIVSGQAQAVPAQPKSSPLEELIRTFEKDPQEGGSRGSCTISPLLPPFSIKYPNIFISDRPTFIWQGSATRIEVRQVADGKQLWGKDLNPGDLVVRYPSNGPALLPGQVYKLRLVSDKDETEIGFQVASTNQQQQIQSGLQDYLKQLPASQKTPSAIAVKQALYLGKQNLWAEAFGRVFSVRQGEISRNEQAEWNRGLSEIRSSVCGSQKKP